MRRKPLLLLPLVICSSAFTLVLAQRQPKAPVPSSVVWKAPPQGQPGDYVGKDTCTGCHPVHAEAFDKTVHADAAPAGTTYGGGCESCHGPGRAHVQAIEAAAGDDAKIAQAKTLIFSFRGKPAENSGRCLNCHVTSKDQSLFERSHHKQTGVSCESCHSAHLTEALDIRYKVEAPIAQAQFWLWRKRIRRS
jgi:hypothetical protein